MKSKKQGNKFLLQQLRKAPRSILPDRRAFCFFFCYVCNPLFLFDFSRFQIRLDELLSGIFPQKL